MASLAVMMTLVSCKCTSDHQTVETTVESIISADRADMESTYGEYQWFETCIVLNDFLDADTTLVFEGVSNIFQVKDSTETGIDTHVISYAHLKDTSSVDVKHGFWVEDKPLNDEQINVTFADALEKVLATNSQKPHSKNVVLRKELGPRAANAQYIFGNKEAQLYVDAVTGDVTDKNPVTLPDEQ